MAVKLTVSHEFVGFGDYWGGNGRRWDDNAGCAFAYYGADTSLRDCVDQWVSDFWQGGDFEYHGDGCDPWEDVTEDDIRAAILNDFLNDRGRADYDSGALAECAVEYAEVNGIDAEDEDDEYDDCSESPIWVILIEIEQCADCGKGDEHVIDDICRECAEKHGYDLTV